VEAGRPDTLTPDMIAVLAKHRIGRISINPQTMHDKTLELIGRSHRAQDIVQAVGACRDAFDFAINMDLIAGLPGETPAMFRETLEEVLALKPANITVHTLAAKRTSRLWEEGGVSLLPGLDTVSEMVDCAYRELAGQGYSPYYLYRQKYMAGNLENVGYAKAGTACLYNIDIMEETHSVLAFGAGAISKWVFPEKKRLERAPNVSDIGHYIARVEEMAARKAALIGR
nr:radical SAM protein [bacterium]